MAGLLKNNFVYEKKGIDFSRSLLPYEKRHSTNLLAGMIVPVHTQFLYPGMTPDWNFGCTVESAPLISTNFDNIYVDVVCIWTPLRLVMTDWNEFLGESHTQAFTINRNITIPKVPTVIVSKATYNNVSFNISRAYLADNFLAPHLGYRLHVDMDTTGSVAGTVAPPTGSIFAKGVSVLPSRIYELNWNTFFRNENIQAPILIDKTSTYGSHDVTYVNGLGRLLMANKLKTWYTVATPAPSLLDVSIGLGELLPVGAVSSQNASFSISTNLGTTYIPAGTYSEGDFVPGRVINSSTGFANNPLLVDTAALTVNRMYYALMEQRFANKMMKGRRAVEFYKNFFGVNDSAAADDLPQLICQKRFPLNISMVVATASATNSDSDVSSELGQKGAFMATGFGDSLVKNFTATEHGYIQTYLIIRGQPSVSTGVDHHLGFDTLLDTYIPEFDHIGPVGIEQLEVADLMPGQALNFGFTNAWYFDRYQTSDVCGIIEPNQPLEYKTLAYNFGQGRSSGAPNIVISDDFIKFDPRIMDRIFTYPVCYVTAGSTVDADEKGQPFDSNRYQFICQFAVKGKTAAVMSPDSEPLKLRL